MCLGQNTLCIEILILKIKTLLTVQQYYNSALCHLSTFFSKNRSQNSTKALVSTDIRAFLET